MPTLRARVASTLFVLGVAAQEPPAGDAQVLAEARAALATGDPAAAFRRLAARAESLVAAGGLAETADVLVKIGKALRADLQFGTALEAAELLLRLRRSVHGDRDHDDVAMDLGDVADCMMGLAREREALQRYEAALAMVQRVHPGRDHRLVLWGHTSVGSCLSRLGRHDQALSHFHEAYEVAQRLAGGSDDPVVVTAAQNLATCNLLLERFDAALLLYEQIRAQHGPQVQDRVDPTARVMLLLATARCLAGLARVDEAQQRIDEALALMSARWGGRDDRSLARCLDQAATCMLDLGQRDRGLEHIGMALAMIERVHGGRDHPEVAGLLQRYGRALIESGRPLDAVPRFEACAAMLRRCFGDQDHPDVAAAISGLGLALDTAGRSDAALPQHRTAAAMAQRLFGENLRMDLPASLNNLALCLRQLGRAGEALENLRSAAALSARLDDPDPVTAAQLQVNIGLCLEGLDRRPEAIESYEAAVAGLRRRHAGADDRTLAVTMGYLAVALADDGRAEAGLELAQQALAMSQRLDGGAATVHTATQHGSVAHCCRHVGRHEQALEHLQAALAIDEAMFGYDHPATADALAVLGACLHDLGRLAEARRRCEQAVAMIERLRGSSRTAGATRQATFDRWKAGQVYERLQDLAIKAGEPAEAWQAAERSRGRELLDLVAQPWSDPFETAIRQARARGDDAAVGRLVALRTEIAANQLASDQTMRALTQLADARLAEPIRERQRQELREHAATLRKTQVRLLDERATLLAGVEATGEARAAADVQAALADGELLLQYCVSGPVDVLYVLSRRGAVEAYPLPGAHEVVQRCLADLVRRSSRAQLDGARGRDPDDRPAPEQADTTAAASLFQALMPAAVWERVRGSKRVFVAAHRDLHRLPFELLVVDVVDGKPEHWLDRGPPISYVPSGSLLHWLRQRAKQARDDDTALDLLAVGDPQRLDAEPEVPEQGVLVLAVQEGGEGARAGLWPRDVLLRYDGQTLADGKALRELLAVVEAAVEDGARADRPIPLELWRRGETIRIVVPKGRLGIEFATAAAGAAYEASLGGAPQPARITRAGDLERLRDLPPLRGARVETEAIEGVFTAKQFRTRRLLGGQATEPMVFDLAAKAKYLHFACHGIAEEYAGQSLSMLVLSPPPQVLPGDDGLLQLGDLLHGWRGRLAATRLVVLSACRTNVGPTLRDEAPQALPVGFLFAGAPAVISSLWAVDDASTRELMTDFYQRLLAGEADQLAAFTAARKALRAKYPDPFHWAPFLYLGAP